MDPAGVAILLGNLGVSVIVQRTELIPEIDQRDSPDGADHPVQQENPADGKLGLLRITLLQCRLQTRERGRGSRDAGVARPRVLLERESSCEAAGEAPGEERREEAAMVRRVDPQLRGILVGECPADIVVAADVL